MTALAFHICILYRFVGCFKFVGFVTADIACLQMRQVGSLLGS